MSRPRPLSGFPEWLPADRVVEQHVLDTLRETFESWGFSSVETRAVEPMEQLLRKGEIDKEVYVLRRLHAVEGEARDGGGDDAGDEGRGDAGDESRDESRQLGLHFDLTVPFARYVLENAGKLAFPFRRYQIQKVWRGERPQEGRFREFTQADVDVVGAGELAFHHEVEVALVMADALGRLQGVGVPAVRIQVNNRRVVEGFFRGVGIADVAAGLRVVDKLDKIGPDAVAGLLVAEAGAEEAQAKACLALAGISAPDASFADQVRALGVSDPLLDQGLEELVRVVEAAAEHAPGMLVADLRIARGLDYYTGTVFETLLDGHEDLGSICSGGRYDALASDGMNTYPGVGLSIGVSRLVSRLVSRGLVRATRAVPSCVLVAVPNEERRADCDRLAATLRRRGIPAEVAPAATRYGKQIRHADRRGIPFVWFPGAGGAGAEGRVAGVDGGAAAGADGGPGGDEVRDIRSGEQVPADVQAWQPPVDDLHLRVVAAQGSQG